MRTKGEERDLRNDLRADAYDELQEIKEAAQDEVLRHSGLGVHENMDGPGYYIGLRTEPEDMLYAVHEKDAQEILEEMQDEYLEEYEG